MHNFVHLHLHSSYSLLDGANRIEDVVKKAAEMKMPALALTDHGNMFGAVQFHDAAVRHGIKPIIGCEVYVAHQGRHHREGRSAGAHHLVLLAADETGYHNLVRLVSLGYLEGFYYRPRIDKELLARHSQGLICLSACLQGAVASNLARDKMEQARREAGEMAEIFGPGNFYLELQDHNIAEQKTVNEGVLKLSRDLDLPLVATNDCHYLEREDHHAHDVLLCIQTGKTIHDVNRLSYKTEEFFFKSAQEMETLFGHVPDALGNTLEIAEKCAFRFGETQNVFPDFAVPDGHDVNSFFEQVVRNGAEERFSELARLEKEGRLRHPFEEYRRRLDHEIQMIQQMNFPAYFLIVWDFIRYARERKIPVGPGRGSAAGSLVSYALRITDVDPLQYDLLFERFLNPERVTPPDIDIDFCMLRRGEVIDYVTRRYGRDNVSHIITFGTMAARGAIRDVGRGLNIPYSEVDPIAKLIPQAPDSSIDKALESVRELQEIAGKDERYRELIHVARRLEGLARHASIHAAGLVIAPRPLIELIPLYKSNKDEITTQYPMSDLERLGLLKMDFLGLTTLTLIEQALQQIQEQLGETVGLDRIPLQDQETMRLFCEGRTTGIFQFESGGMRDILRRLQPSRFEDLIALNALYRPGPIQGGMIDDFIDRRHGKVKVTYDLPQLEQILKETYGVIVYQEQVMQIASSLAGFSLGEADLLRRAMGKKKKSVMEAQRRKFLEGARARQVEPAKARKIFDLMEQFAGYGFNKSHSTAYALLAYQTAYLKAHYPVQFMAALLTSEMSNTDKIVQYLGECKEMGIAVVPPDINSSRLHFVGSTQKEIKFGLAAIKNVGESAIRSILNCREKIGPFQSLFQFFEQVDLRLVNKRVMESLIKSGAFDTLGVKRKSMAQSLDGLMEHGQKRQRDRLSGQKGLFASIESPAAAMDAQQEIADVGEWPDREKWTYEKQTLGFYVSGHPLEKYSSELKRFSQFSTQQLDENTGKREVTVGGIVTAVRNLQTRKGESMATFKLEDLEGTVEVLVWPRLYESCKELLSGDAAILVTGRCEVDARGEMRLLASEIRPMGTIWQTGVQKTRIRIPVDSLQQTLVVRLKSLLQQFPGPCPLEFELVSPRRFTIHVVPEESFSVNPEPSFVQQVEALIGEKSCILQV